MQRCLDLANLAAGFTSPNPMVGAVLVHNHRIIGEGYHHGAGLPHAEVNCFASVNPKDQALVSQSTLYVSLEPCAHYGKTPPCAALILEKKVPRVVVAMRDPFPEVAGRGIEMLRAAGVEVVVGVLEDKARYLNRFFLKAVEENRPWVTLKWAESSDGYIDKLRTAQEEPVRFSSPLRLRTVHKMRQLHDAILVGRCTVEMDNPQLNTRYWWGRSPQRIILDRNASLLGKSYCVNTSSEGTPSWFVVSLAKEARALALSSKESVIAIPSGAQFIAHLLHALKAKGIQSLLVEGGAQVLQSFIDSGLYDEVVREVVPIVLGEGVVAPHLP